MSTSPTILRSAEVRDQYRERAIVFLDETFGDDQFVIGEATEQFASGMDIDLDDLRHRPAAVEAGRAIRWAAKDSILNGFPRYLWTGGLVYQRSTAVEPETLTRLENRTQASIGGQIRRSQMLLQLRASKTGETIDDLARQRHDFIEDLERQLSLA